MFRSNADIPFNPQFSVNNFDVRGNYQQFNNGSSAEHSHFDFTEIQVYMDILTILNTRFTDLQQRAPNWEIGVGLHLLDRLNSWMLKQYNNLQGSRGQRSGISVEQHTDKNQIEVYNKILHIITRQATDLHRNDLLYNTTQLARRLSFTPPQQPWLNPLYNPQNNMQPRPPFPNRPLGLQRKKHPRKKAGKAQQSQLQNQPPLNKSNTSQQQGSSGKVGLPATFVGQQQDTKKILKHEILDDDVEIIVIKTPKDEIPEVGSVVPKVETKSGDAKIPKVEDPEVSLVIPKVEEDKVAMECSNIPKDKDKFCGIDKQNTQIITDNNCASDEDVIIIPNQQKTFIISDDEQGTSIDVNQQKAFIPNQRNTSTANQLIGQGPRHIPFVDSTNGDDVIEVPVQQSGVTAKENPSVIAKTVPLKNQRPLNGGAKKIPTNLNPLFDRYQLTRKQKSSLSKQMNDTNVSNLSTVLRSMHAMVRQNVQRQRMMANRERKKM